MRCVSHGEDLKSLLQNQHCPGKLPKSGKPLSAFPMATYSLYNALLLTRLLGLPVKSSALYRVVAVHYIGS